MADINLFRGGSTPLASMGADCACGPYPSTYPAPNRVANHMREQVFTLAASLDPTDNVNVQCVLCSTGNTGAAILNRKIGLMRVPAAHLLSAVRMVLEPGNGAGGVFSVYADRVNPVTGAVVSSVTMPAAATGNTMAAALDEFYAIGTAPGEWSGANVIEIGIVMTTAPTATDLCSWTGSITLVAKVEGFDYGAN